LSSPKTEMVSGIFVNESGRMLVSLFVWIGKRVTILLPIFFYHKLAQSLLTMGFGLVVTPPAHQQVSTANNLPPFLNLWIVGNAEICPT
jgi:hypothetical protein